MSRVRAALPIAGALFIALAACGRKPASEPARPEFQPVVAAAIETLSARVARERAESMSPETMSPETMSSESISAEELEERVSALLEATARAHGSERELGIADLSASPPAATRKFVTRALDDAQPAAERFLCVELLAERDGHEDAAGLLEIAELASDAQLRANACWRLGRSAHDEFLPRLTLRLRYEVDWEAVLWLGQALCAHGLYSGLDGLLAVAEGAPDDALRAQATHEAQALAAAVGVADAYELAELWRSGAQDVRLEPRPRSDAYRLELWRWIARFDEYQLRGVDDCRFLMARLDAPAAEVLAAALSDASPYVRLGVAQSLARMGARARVAGPALVAALEDPELAPWMASALASVAYAPAREELEARLGRDHDAALRVACARGLGGLGLDESIPALRAAFTQLDRADPPELAQALAESLVLCGDREPPLATLIDALTDERLEPSTSTVALRVHLARRAAALAPGAVERLARWDELEQEFAARGAPAGGARAARALEAARAELLRD